MVLNQTLLQFFLFHVLLGPLDFLSPLGSVLVNYICIKGCLFHPGFQIYLHGAVQSSLLFYFKFPLFLWLFLPCCILSGNMLFSSPVF